LITPKDRVVENIKRALDAPISIAAGFATLIEEYSIFSIEKRMDDYESFVLKAHLAQNINRIVDLSGDDGEVLYYMMDSQHDTLRHMGLSGAHLEIYSNSLYLIRSDSRVKFREISLDENPPERITKVRQVALDHFEIIKIRTNHDIDLARRGIYPDAQKLDALRTLSLGAHEARAINQCVILAEGDEGRLRTLLDILREVLTLSGVLRATAEKWRYSGDVGMLTTRAIEILDS
jgi:hypothetical protein